jgi:hypothetical protein
MFLAVALAAACALFGCGIFDMKDPEAPVGVPSPEDPLNIGDIIRIARESALNMDYRDYFTDNVRFEYTLFRSIEGRENLIRMLNRLRAQTTFVEWQVERANKRLEGNRQIVENVPYIVYSGDRQICSGMADFHIVRETDWVISYWKDVPNEHNTPFFEP